MTDIFKGEPFPGKLPGGEIVDFRLATGRIYINTCPDCGQSNGGGVETAEHPAQDDDEYSPLNTPCMRCGKGPMVVEYLDEKGTS
jgi:hypothetical protein